MVDSCLSLQWKHQARSDVKAKLAELDHEAMESGDPCLADCCRRDVTDQVFASRRDEFLAQHDPTRQRAALLSAHGDPRPGDIADMQGEEADQDLERLRQDRLQQLQRADTARAHAATQGHGTFADVSEDEALEALEGAAAVVLHAHQGTGAEADELLTVLSHRFFGTRFIRAAAAACPRVLLRYRLEPGGWIVAVKRGKVVGVRPSVPPPDEERDELDDLDANLDATWEEQTEEWLLCLGVLCRDVSTTTGTRDGPGHAESDSDNDEEGTELNAPCPTCGRTYYHVHRPAVRQSNLMADVEEDF